MIPAFKNDPYFLLRYYVVSTILSVAILGWLAVHPLYDFGPLLWVWLICLLPLIGSSFVGTIFSNMLSVGLAIYTFHGSLTPWHALLVPLGIFLGMWNVPAIHNCAHGNFRPRWLNRPLGELCSLNLLSGFPGFAILHLLHHQHPDDPQKDPHPNGDKTFWEYLNGLKVTLGSAFRNFYIQQWGDGPRARLIWRTVRILLATNRVLRALILLFLMGPIGFALIYVPSIISNRLTYAHINYYAHAKQSDGSIAILDFTDGWYHRFFNRYLMGIYLHRTHHEHASVFNPYRYLKEQGR